MQVRKIFFSSITIIAISLVSKVDAEERSDIYQVLREINYIEEVVRELRNKYGNNQAKVRFNYDAMLHQLQVIRVRTEEFLNYDIQKLHAHPPATVAPSLSIVRKN